MAELQIKTLTGENAKLNGTAVEDFRSSLRGDLLLSGENGYERLVTVKNKYDPMNLFRLNQNIKPTA